MKKTNKIRIGLFIFIFISVLLYLGYKVHQEKEYIEQGSYQLFSEEELKGFKPFENQTLTFGYKQGQELGFRFGLGDVLQDEFGIKSEFIKFETEEKLLKAAQSGEIDILIQLSKGQLTEDLFSVAMSIPNHQWVITHVNAPLGSASQLVGSNIGFITGSSMYLDFEETVGKENFNIFFFDSLTEMLDAVENQEVDAVITRMDTALKELVGREQLQIELTFQNKIIRAEFATANEQLQYPLEILEGIMNSPRVDQFVHRLEGANSNSIKSVARTYIQNKYPEVVSRYDHIKIGMHNANFPYSFFEQDGTPTGVYLEVLDLFQLTTDIEYKVMNTKENTNYNELLEMLMDNQLHFLVGITGTNHKENILNIGTHKIQDNMVSVEKYGSNSTSKNVSALKFGMIESHGFTELRLGINHLVTFKTYQEAIEDLLEGEIDVLILRKSVLDYYRNVMGSHWLNQTPHINRLSSQQLLGHEENMELNEVMSDMVRLHTLVNLGQSDLRWENRVVNYRGKYVELQSRQQRFLTLMVSGLLVVISVWIIKKEKEMIRLKRENEHDQLTGLYNKHTYEQKCQKLIDKYPNKLGIFFFIDLDDFKSVNDTYGHETGDRMIIKFAELLMTLRGGNPNTICFRISGDEFGIFSMGYESREEIHELILTMKQKLEGQIKADAATGLVIKFSAGGSIFNYDTANFSLLKKYADFAMYQAKRNKGQGNNQVRLFQLNELYLSHKENLKCKKK